eukprot:2713212-Pyramimonas_sp.AAC.1
MRARWSSTASKHGRPVAGSFTVIMGAAGLGANLFTMLCRRLRFLWLAALSLPLPPSPPSSAASRS